MLCSCQHGENSSFVCWNFFLEIFSDIFICSWLNPQMWNVWIWRANCLAFFNQWCRKLVTEHCWVSVGSAGRKFWAEWRAGNKTFISCKSVETISRVPVEFPIPEWTVMLAWRWKKQWFCKVNTEGWARPCVTKTKDNRSYTGFLGLP